MDDLGINAKQLAYRTGIHYNTIINYTHGKTQPTAPKIITIARVLRTSSDYLLGLSDDIC